MSLGQPIVKRSIPRFDEFFRLSEIRDKSYDRKEVFNFYLARTVFM